jgi:hypothetical protein
MTDWKINFKLDPNAGRQHSQTRAASGSANPQRTAWHVPNAVAVDTSEPVDSKITLVDPLDLVEAHEQDRAAQVREIEITMRALEVNLQAHLNVKGDLIINHDRVQAMISQNSKTRRVFPNPHSVFNILRVEGLVLALIVLAFHAIAASHRIALESWFQLAIYTLVLVGFVIGNIYNSVAVGRQEFIGRVKRASQAWSWLTLIGSVVIDVALGLQSYFLSVKFMPFERVPEYVYVLPMVAAVLHVALRKYAVDFGLGRAAHDKVADVLKQGKEYAQLEAHNDELERLTQRGDA